MKLVAQMKLSHITSSHCCSSQKDSCACEIQNKEEENGKEKAHTSLLV